MPDNPYRLARQRHVGEALDDLGRQGRLVWYWDYNFKRSRAIYNVTIGDALMVLDTKGAEDLVQRHYDELGVYWLPVPRPGGQRQRQEVQRLIAEGEPPQPHN